MRFRQNSEQIPTTSALDSQAPHTLDSAMVDMLGEWDHESLDQHWVAHCL